MPTNFPTGLDQYNPVPTNQLIAVKHHDRHQNVEDAVEAIEAYVGTSTSTDPTSITYRLLQLLSSAGSSLIGFLQAGVSAVARTLQDKGRERLTPFDFGAVGNGIADDRAALLAADAAAFSQGKPLVIPYGTFQVGDALTGLRASWLGEKGHLIRASNTLVLNGPSMLEWAAGSNGLSVRNLNVDFQSRVCTVGSEAVIGIAASDNWEVTGCTVSNLTGSGIAANGARNFTISHNTIKKAAFANTYNQAILVSSSARQSNNGTISSNVCENSAINVSVANCTISDNDIYNWGFGGGITTEQDTANSFNYTIENNRIRGGQGIDTNLTRPMGIENWGPNSTIRGNICWDNSGSGIDQGGQNTRCHDNMCFNNGRTLPTGGIIARYGNATFNASGSSFHGNKCFDTQGSPTQTTGYLEQSALLTGLSIRGNQFNSGVGVTPENIISSAPDYEGPILHGGPVSWDPASIAIGANATTTINVPGAALGDYADVSFTQDMQGMSFTGYVTGTNTVVAVIANNTSAPRDVVSGFLRAKVEKPKNYAPY